MKAAELRGRTDEELQEQLTELKEELFGLKFQHVLGQIEDTGTLKRARRDIARINTVLHERQQGLR